MSNKFSPLDLIIIWMFEPYLTEYEVKEVLGFGKFLGIKDGTHYTVKVPWYHGILA